jgi:hypothetical protein
MQFISNFLILYNYSNQSGGQANRKSTNPDLIPLSQIRKFLRCANPKIANRKLLQNAAQPCLKTLLKDVFYTIFCFVQIYIRALYAIFVRGKKFAFADLRKFNKSANHQKIGPQIAKSAKYHICERSANLTTYLSHQICGFTICESYSRPPTVASN